MDPAYARLGLAVSATPCTVLRASRHRFYRAMLASHASLQAETAPLGAD
ncbi:hypothetical protein J7443_18525 [Tropicibacter sp. R15_0]|nr:hypothetical protein [Tropicibacter sp. R15_0]MBO9467244.1 hypothetical protein [Tropicibacter sp. R15_0]